MVRRVTVTYHAVLAGAYLGGPRANPQHTLVHASVDDGESALCNRVKRWSLCDVQEQAVTCKVCARKLAKLGVP